MTEPIAPIATLAADLRTQRDFLASRIPVYGRLLAHLEQSLDQHAAALAAAWSGRRFGAFYERPLLILAALRDDALAEGPGHPLWSAIGAPVPDLLAATPQALRAALAPERLRMWRSLRERHLQTNETARAVAWLWPAHLCALADPDRAVALVDIGASAGLNLIADALPPMWTTTDGAPLMLEPRPAIAGRTGFDPRPIDVRDEADARWLRACVRPGQTARLQRLEAGIAELRASAGLAQVVAAGAGEVPERLRRPGPGQRMLCHQSIVRDFIPAGERERYQAGMRAFLAGNRPGAVLWIELEVTDRARAGGPPAAITAHILSRDHHIQSLLLAHCEPNPVVLDIDEAAVAALLEHLR